MSHAHSRAPGSESVAEVTALLADLDALGKAVGGDAAAEGGAGGAPGSDAYFAFLPARCVVWSTVVMVLDLYSCPSHMRPSGSGGVGRSSSSNGSSDSELELKAEAISGLLAGAVRVRDEAGCLLGVMREAGEEVAARVSPLCLDVLYCGMATFAWLWEENGDGEMKEGLEVTRRCLRRIGARWRLAAEYVEIGER